MRDLIWEKRDSDRPTVEAVLGSGYRAIIELPNMWHSSTWTLQVTYAGFGFAEPKHFKSLRGAKSFVEKNRGSWK